jgi:alginate O-acetyltransferase complex protein AlgI
MLTMLIGGLWHGASWTFVLWGGYHGVLLILDKLGQPFLRRLKPMLYRSITLLLVVIGWVFFRSADFHMATSWLGQMFLPATLSWSVLPKTAAWVAFGLMVVFAVPETWDLHFSYRRRWAVVFALAFLFTYLFMNGTESIFLYYQF